MFPSGNLGVARWPRSQLARCTRGGRSCGALWSESGGESLAQTAGSRASLAAPAQTISDGPATSRIWAWRSDYDRLDVRFMPWVHVGISLLPPQLRAARRRWTACLAPTAVASRFAPRSGIARPIAPAPDDRPRGARQCRDPRPRGQLLRLYSRTPSAQSAVSRPRLDPHGRLDRIRW